MLLDERGVAVLRLIGSGKAMLLCAAALMVAGAPALAAEPWAGRWAANFAWCFQAEALLPEGILRIGADRLTVAETACRIDEVSEIEVGRTWRFRLHCDDGGERAIEIDVDGDRLLYTPAEGGVRTFVRCPELG